MGYALVLCAILTDSETTAHPSHADIIKAVVSSREKIRSLCVHCVSRQPLKNEEAERTMYLDVDARRWRVDVELRGPSTSKESEGFHRRRSVDGDGDVVYEYYPTQENMAAKKLSLRSAVSRHHVKPFPDPRNAGIVARLSSDIGTPFEIAGSRASIDSSTLMCEKANRVTVRSVDWRGEPSWKVEAAIVGGPQGTTICRYVVVPKWDWAVVLLEVTFSRDNGGTPDAAFRVETDVALHHGSRLWFPKKAHLSTTAAGKKIQEEMTDFEVVSLNEPLPESTFTFKGMGVPAGHPVTDSTEESIGKKIWDGDKITTVGGPSPILVQSGWQRSTLFRLSIGILCLVVVLLFARYLSNRRASSAPS